MTARTAPLLAATFLAGLLAGGAAAAPPTGEIDAAIEKGVAFLLQRQNPNGSWGSARNTKGLNIYAPVPGAHHAFCAGTTSLCLAALLELEPGPLVTIGLGLKGEPDGRGRGCDSGRGDGRRGRGGRRRGRGNRSWSRRSGGGRRGSL